MLGPAHTEPAFEVRDLGPFPGLVRGGAHTVAGKVYEVDAPTLARLGSPAWHSNVASHSRQCVRTTWIRI
jgi:gamma-glutamylcyclotransferase (GGCT)/AIG2-like uncharacterized protein YtfP